MWKNEGRRRQLIMTGVVQSVLLTSLRMIRVGGQVEPGFDQRVPYTAYPSDGNTNSPASPSPRYPAPIIHDPTATSSSPPSSAFPAGSNIPISAASSSSSSSLPTIPPPPPPLPGPSSSSGSSNTNASSSVDTTKQTQQNSITGGLKPEIVMAVVLAGCLGLVFLILAGLFLWSRCVRPRIRAAYAYSHKSNPNDDDDQKKKKEEEEDEEDAVETADPGTSHPSSSASAVASGSVSAVGDGAT